MGSSQEALIQGGRGGFPAREGRPYLQFLPTPSKSRMADSLAEP